MATPGTVPDSNIVAFHDNLGLSIQQHHSILQKTMSAPTEPYKGKGLRPAEYIEPVSAVETTGSRFGTSAAVEPQRIQRWVEPRDFKVQLKMDRRDNLKNLQDPTSPYIMAMTAAINRDMDRKVCKDVWFGNVKTGDQGADTRVFDPTMVQTATALSATAVFDACDKVLETFENNDIIIEDEEVWAIISPQMKRIMFGDVTMISSDFQVQKGVVSTYQLPMRHGINWVVASFLSKTAVTLTWEVPLYLKSGMQFGKWENLDTKIDELPTENHAKQLSAYITAGATRLDELKCGQLLVPSS